MEQMTRQEWAATPKGSRHIGEDGQRWVLRLIKEVTTLVKVEVR